MSKTKENPNIDFHLAQIEEVGFSMNLPEASKASAGFQFNIFLEAGVNPDKRRFVVDNRVEIRTEVNEPLLAHLIVRYIFDLVGFENLKKNKKGVHIIPPSIQLALNTIALSTTRGLLFARFKGTPLHNAILPLIDASNFSVNEVED
jgi:hypothetical protein